MHDTSSQYTFHALLNTTSAYRAILMTFARCFAVLMELSEHYRYYCGHPEYVSASPISGLAVVQLTNIGSFGCRSV